MVSAVVVLAFYLVAIFADPLAVIAALGHQRDAAATSRRRRSIGSTTAAFRPHVYGLKGKRDLRTFKLSYAPDPSEKRFLDPVRPWLSVPACSG